MACSDGVLVSVAALFLFLVWQSLRTFYQMGPKFESKESLSLKVPIQLGYLFVI